MDNWKNVLLAPSNTIKCAIGVLNKEKPRIVLVVNEFNYLIGTVTDGDIRRALIRNCAMDTLIAEVMNKNPRTGLIGEDNLVVIERMVKYSLLQMPIVDEEGVVQGLEMLRHHTEKKKYDNPVFIMAGGFGKRLRPLTENTPKPMLKVGTKPILETIFEKFIKCGFHKFYISTHYKAEMVHDYFGDGGKWGVSINYLNEDKPLGTAGSLGLLPSDLPNLPLLVMNGDLLTNIDFEELLQFHSEQGGIATVCVREYDFQVPYGVVNRDGYKVKSIVEKPVHNFFVNAGIYILDHTIINNINGGEYLDMPNLLEQCISEGEQVSMFPIHEYWLDIGRIEEYEKAQAEISGFRQR